MTVNFVFDEIDPNSTWLTSNLIGSYYNNKKDFDDLPYWYEWGGDINKHLLKNYEWNTVKDENTIFKCNLTSNHWDLFSRVEVLKDVPYLITLDIKLYTATNCNISVLDGDVWTFLCGRSFSLEDNQLSMSEWTSVTIEMLPSTSGYIHLHIGALDSKLPIQSEGTVFIKNFKVKSETTSLLIDHLDVHNGSYSVEHTEKQNPSCILLSEINNYENDFNVYPIVITTAEHYYCWPLLLLRKKIVDLVNEDKLKILLVCSFETIRPSFLLIHQQVAKICVHQNIKKLDNIIFASSDSTIERRTVEYEKEILKHNPNAQLIKFKDVNAYIHIIAMIIKSLTNSRLPIHDNFDWLENYFKNYSNKPYLFLYLNNRITGHRYWFYKYMEYKNLLQYGIYSWNGYNQPNLSIYDPVSDFSRLKQTITENEAQRFIDYVMSNPNIEITKIKDDHFVLTSDPMREGSLIIPSWISDTYFSVVTETHCGDLPSHITEKIYKLIFYCHPFIVIGPTFHLKTLRRHGFKTFPELFDESYDSMPETLEKYNFISNQIKFYSSEEGRKKLIEILPTLKKTLEYNRNLLLSLSPSSHEIWNSLENLYKK